MKNKRKRHDSQLKARVALEALKGLKTVQQTAKEFGTHPGQVSDWKKQLSEQAGIVFEGGKSREVEDFDKEREGLHSKIGELTVRLEQTKGPNKQRACPSVKKNACPVAFSSYPSAMRQRTNKRPVPL